MLDVCQLNSGMEGRERALDIEEEVELSLPGPLRMSRVLAVEEERDLVAREVESLSSSRMAVGSGYERCPEEPQRQSTYSFIPAACF